MFRTKLTILVCAFLLTLPCGCAYGAAARVAVFPFENLSGVASDDWLRDGFSESVTDHLQYVEDFEVVDREELNAAAASLNSPVYFPFEEEPAVELGKALKLKYAVIGSFRHRGDEMVLFSRIIDIKAGKTIHRFRQRSEAPSNYRFFKQAGEVAANALPAMGIREGKVKNLSKKMEPAGKRTEKIKAFEFYVLGRLALFAGSEDDLRLSTTWFREAIALDYRYALAYAGLAQAFANWGFLNKQDNKPYQEFYRKSHEAVNSAMQYDPQTPQFHFKRTMIFLDADVEFLVGETRLRNKEYKAAIAAYKQNLSVTPNDASTIYKIGEAYLGLGDKHQAEVQFKRALAISPRFLPALDRLEGMTRGE